MALEFEVDEDASEIFIVLFEAMIQFLDLWLVQEPQYFLLELPTAFAGDDLNEFDFPVNRFLHNPIKFRVDLIAAVVYVVQVQFKLCHDPLVSSAVSKNQTAGAGSA